VDGWSSDEPDEIVVGDRRMRVRRRMRRRGGATVASIAIVLVVLAGAGYGVYVWGNRPTGLAALPNPTVVAPGAFRASVGADKTITVGLEIRNVADVPVTVTSARVVAPDGLHGLGVSLISPGEGNQGFALDRALPSSAAVKLGTNGIDRNGILAARFRIDCDSLPPAGGPTGEQIFVTVKLGAEERQEQLTPPVLDGTPWLTATARRACTEPVATSSPAPPLPPLPSTG
jgi:hypothetical protein